MYIRIINIYSETVFFSVFVSLCGPDFPCHKLQRPHACRPWPSTLGFGHWLRVAKKDRLLLHPGPASYSGRWQTTAIQGTMRFRVAPLLFKAHAPIQSSATRLVESTAGELYTLQASTLSTAAKGVKLTITIYCCEVPRRQLLSLARGVHGTVRFLSIHGNYSALH